MKAAAEMSNAPYKHAEAYMLMLYTSKGGTRNELIWNSRDGVTPFIVRGFSGEELTHASFKKDVRIERLLPPVGMRIFVDLSPKRAREVGNAWADNFWDAGLKHYFPTKEAAVLSWVSHLHDGEPDLVTVDAALQQELAAKYAADGGEVETNRPWDCYQFLYRQPVRFA
jgi:hypothetical protein